MYTKLSIVEYFRNLYK